MGGRLVTNGFDDKHGNQVRISAIKTQCYMQKVANGFRLSVFQRQVEYNKRPETKSEPLKLGLKGPHKETHGHHGRLEF